MIQNLWNDIKIVCGNCKTHTPLEPKIAESLFYSCPKYYDFNRTPDERPCGNRISGIDYERMVDHISKKIQEASLNFEKIWFQGYTFKIKNIEFKVLSHKDDEIIVTVLNKTALGRK